MPRWYTSKREKIDRQSVTNRGFVRRPIASSAENVQRSIDLKKARKEKAKTFQVDDKVLTPAGEGIVTAIEDYNVVVRVGRRKPQKYAPEILELLSS